MTEWPRYYVLVDRVPFATDVMSWARWFEVNRDKRRIAETWLAGSFSKARISTVFLGLDHNMHGSGDPVLFETMIFGGPLDGEQWRYCYYDEAEKGHAAAVDLARKAVKSIARIAGDAGAKP